MGRSATSARRAGVSGMSLPNRTASTRLAGSRDRPETAGVELSGTSSCDCSRDSRGYSCVSAGNCPA
ncbi:MAG: hypothetical protein HZA50_00130 [Planctomycetes bacterium]|nr:hypothetical protein [Planctomycetota bacterium]